MVTCSHEIKRRLLLGRKVMTNLRQHIIKQRHYFADKGPSSQSYDFSSSHVWMWELDYKESWAPKNWCFWTVVLKSLEILLDCKEIQPFHPKGNQFWIFTGRTDAMLCYAKSRQSCPTLCDPIDGSPPGSPVPEILQARTLEWVAISFSNALKWKVKGKSLSCVRLLATPWIAA